MQVLRPWLATVVLALWWPSAWPVELAPGQGVSFAQIGYRDDPASASTPIGVMRVDLNELRGSTGIAAGYLNLATAKGWVVRNLPVFPEASYPYSGINSDFDLGVALGVPVSQLTAALRYTEESLSTFTATPGTSFGVAPLQLLIGGAQAGAGGPVAPPTFNDILFANPNDTDTALQLDHPNIETAKNQCVPMSIANSLKYLKDTQGLQLPHTHKPGQNGDDSLVGQLDVAGNRSVTSRQAGSGLPGLLTPKLTYLASNGLQERISTTSWGSFGIDAAGANKSISVNNATASSTAMGNTINFDQLMAALKEGQDCEMIYSWTSPTPGAHAVDIVGAGRYKGQPWILHASDLIQADAGNPNADSQGAGPEGLKFEYLGAADANGQYSFRNRTMRQLVCEKYVPPPATETVTRVADPAGHSCCVNPPPASVGIAVNGSTMTMTGNASWLPLTGTIAANGSFSLASTATVAGFGNVTTSFTGTRQGSTYTGTITVGTGGQLPTGQAIAYDVSISAQAAGGTPAMRINGFRSMYGAKSGELLRPSVSMKAGSQAGQPADWWVLASTNGVTFHLDLASMGWLPGVAPTYTGPLFDLPFFPLPAFRLPAGTYDFQFGFDTVADGALTPAAASLDSLRLTVP